MSYISHEKIQELSWYIQTKYTAKREDFDIHTNEAELTWNASGFWAKILHLAEPLGHEITLANFEEFKANYQREKGITIDSEQLFNSFWLRRVLGFVEIPYSISSSFYHLEKIQPYKEHFPFLFDFYQSLGSNNKLAERAIFSQALSDYNSKNNFLINENELLEAYNGLVSVKEDKLEFGNIDYYFKPIFDHWDKLEFIYSLNKSFKKEKHLLIKKTNFNNIHGSYVKFYPDTPTLETFKEGGLLKDSGEHYALNFNGPLPSYWFYLGDKISAKYWDLLVNDSSFTADKERIRHFLSQIKYWGQPSCNLNYATQNAKNRFLDAAFELIMNETDIVGIEDEFYKVSVDNRNAGFANFIHLDESVKKEFPLDNSEVFELSASLNLWEKKSFDTMFFEGSRDKLAGLIRQIIIHEAPKTDGIKYKRIKELIRASLNKPSLLGFVTHAINYWRKEVAPFLLEDLEFVSFYFQLVSIFDSPYRSDNELLQDKLVVEGLDIALQTVKLNNHNRTEVAKIIFQLFRQLNRNKYEIPYNKTKKEKEAIKEYKRKTEELLLTKIENCSKTGATIYNGNSEFLIPYLLNDLINCFSNYTEKPYYNNGVISMPLLQLDGIIWLMKCSTLWKYKTQGAINKPNIELLTNTFLKLYQDNIEIEQVEKYNYFEKKEEIGLPLWSEKFERIGYLEWIYPIYFLYEHQQLAAFLSPKLDLERTADEYNKKNQFVSDKLRTHIGVLLHVLRAFTLPAIPYGFEKNSIEKIRKQIEKKIIAVLELHNTDSPKDGKIDLLDYKRDTSYNMSNENALLPELSSIINWFEDKEAIIDALTQTNDVIKTLTILEWVTSEGIKSQLLAKIKQSDLQKFLEESTWLPEIQSVLLKMAQYGDLIAKVKEVVSYWEANIKAQKKDYAKTLYQTKLLIAYYNNNEAELDLVGKPDGNEIKSSQETTYNEQKEFYRALIQIHSHPENAYAINDTLCKKYPHLSGFAVNRMAAKMNIAKKTDKSELYKEALEEWRDFEGKNKNIDYDDLGNAFIANKLFILLKLNEFEVLAYEYAKLNLSYKMIPSILESKLESLIVQNKIEEAENLLSQAEHYHKFASEIEFELIKEFRLRISGIDDTERLSNYYNRIFNCSAKKLIQIFPEKFNGKRDLYEFITREIAMVAGKMLDKIKSIDAIAAENKYNDLIHVLLQTRMSQWGWFVGDQSRKGSSPSGPELGEIDIEFLDSNSSPIITCEAFILRNPDKVREHLEKLIGKYTHKRKSLIALVYFEGEHGNFKAEWKKYCEATIPKLTYPAGYELKSDKVIDKTKEFDCEESGVKVGYALHGDNTSVYHVFVNINYFVS